MLSAFVLLRDWISCAIIRWLHWAVVARKAWNVMWYRHGGRVTLTVTGFSPRRRMNGMSGRVKGNVVRWRWGGLPCPFNAVCHCARILKKFLFLYETKTGRYELVNWGWGGFLLKIRVSWDDRQRYCQLPDHRYSGKSKSKFSLLNRSKERRDKTTEISPATLRETTARIAQSV